MLFFDCLENANIVPKELAASFKAKCSEKGVSQAQIIKAALEAFVNS